MACTSRLQTVSEKTGAKNAFQRGERPAARVASHGMSHAIRLVVNLLMLDSGVTGECCRSTGEQQCSAVALVVIVTDCDGKTSA